MPKVPDSPVPTVRNAGLSGLLLRRALSGAYALTLLAAPLSYEVTATDEKLSSSRAFDREVVFVVRDEWELVEGGGLV